MGRVKSLQTNKFLPGCDNGHGYLRVQLWKHNNGKNKLIHRLVIEAFIEKPQSDKTLISNHKDGDKTNNRADNLEWVTYSENTNHAFDIGICDHRRGQKLWNSKFTEQQVKDIKKRLSKGESLTIIAKDYNVTKGAISHIKANRNWKHIKVGVV